MREACLVSDDDETVFFHFLVADRSTRAKFRPPMVEIELHLGLIDVENGDPQHLLMEKCRKDDKYSCRAVSYVP